MPVDSDIEYEKTIYENLEKGYQLRLVVNEFRSVQYLHVRKYFLSYEGTWTPSKEGISMAASLQNIFGLLDGLIEISSKSESLDSIITHFENKISELKSST